MKKLSKWIGSSLLAAALVVPAVAPVAVRAQDAAHRYYDANRKEYHNWDANEDASWRRYEADQHKKHKDFEKATKEEQQAYWDWRHDHPDPR
jgi:hypothetical protein